MNNIQIDTRKEVLNKTKWSLSTLRRQELDQTFVPPINMGARSVGYISEEVDTVIAARSVGLDDDSLRKLVAKLVKQRQERASRFLDACPA